MRSPRAVSALLQHFRSTNVERIELTPRALGVARLGHLGVFRPGQTERVWAEILQYALKHAESSQPDQSVQLEHQPVMQHESVA